MPIELKLIHFLIDHVMNRGNQMIDLHCDTILLLDEAGDRANLMKNPFSVDLKKLQKNKSLAQFFALFIELEAFDEPWDYFEKLYYRFNKEMDENREIIKHVRSYDEMINNDQLSAFLTVEEGGIIGKDFSKLEKLYELGVRLITLTWNFPNSIGFPNVNGHSDKGLTKFGKEVVEYMNSTGMIVDVSHLSDAGFWDVANISNKPFIASHSNARSIVNHSRNLTDPMIKAIADSGGVIGINFCPSFINKEGVSTIDMIVKHMLHIIDQGGIDVMAIGTDFDGIKGPLEIEDISQMYLLKEALMKKGLTENQINKIWQQNAKRVIREVL